MGKGFGQLAHMRGIIMYRLSPFEQKAFAGAIKHGVPNMFRRFRQEVFYVAPCKDSRTYFGKFNNFPFSAFVVGYLIYNYGETEFKRLARKNPADYENDK